VKKKAMMPVKLVPAIVARVKTAKLKNWNPKKQITRPIIKKRMKKIFL